MPGRKTIPPPTSESRAGRALDLDHLEKVTLADPALMNELLRLFQVQARVQLNLISIARRAGDFHLAVHTLKGAALAIGASAIAAAAERLEALGFCSDAETRRDELRRLRDEIAAAEDEIAEIIA